MADSALFRRARDGPRILLGQGDQEEPPVGGRGRGGGRGGGRGRGVLPKVLQLVGQVNFARNRRLWGIRAHQTTPLERNTAET